MKRFLLLLGLFLSLMPVAWAKQPFNNLTLQSGEVLRGSFVQERRMNGFERPLKSEGSFVISPSNGVIWNVVKPFATVTALTPQGLVQSSNGTKTVQLTSQKMPFVAHLYEMIGGVLTGKWDALEKTFLIEQKGMAKQWQMRLVPRKADDPLMPFKEIKVKGGRFVHEVSMIKPDGDSDVLSFDGVTQTKSSLSAAELSIFGLVSP